MKAASLLWQPTGKEMVHVQAGPFLYGERRELRELPAFWIDRTPVTNAEYARFLAACPAHPVPGAPELWAQPYRWDPETRSFPPGRAGHPVALIAWYDVLAYAEWAGGRAPSEAEWEKAARGTDGRRYPWGAWDDDRCNTEETGLATTTPVDAYSPRGDSPYGCTDMAGNVWEWTARGAAEWMLRGGSFVNDRFQARATYRGPDLPDSGIRLCGLRLVVDTAGVAAQTLGRPEP